MKSPRRKIELSEGQWAIMKVVWRLQPCAAPTVREALLQSRNWSYSTVRTLMDRMVPQGLLTTEKIRNLTLYRAAITPREAQRGEVLYTLRHAFNGALTPMVQCLLDSHETTPEQLEELEKFIHKKRRDTES
ncbi:MAG: BlaI/MecI/CopY family transcriptional regulator [Verrucomicrobiota bacterium]|jgi:predicted transcriptional regulator